MGVAGSLTPVSRRRLHESVSEQPLRAIQAGEFPVDTRLPSERELSRVFGVTRPVVREALQSLERLGTLQISQGERAIVLRVTPDSIVEKFTESVRTLIATDARRARAFQGGAARLRVRHRAHRGGTRAPRTAWRACGGAGGRQGRDLSPAGIRRSRRRIPRHHRRTHRQPAVPGRKPGHLQLAFRVPSGSVHMPGREFLTLQEHEAILARLERRDGDGAEAAMRHHLTRAERPLQARCPTRLEKRSTTNKGRPTAGRGRIAMATTLKALCRSRGRKFGHFVVEFATPGIGHILKGAGCDFVLFDTEHSGFGFETIKSAVRYFEAAQLPAIVRVPSKAYDQIARAADMGAEAVMVPMVDTAEEAAELASYLKYTPLGRRGVALGIAHDNYRAGTVTEKLAGRQRAHLPVRPDRDRVRRGACRGNRRGGRAWIASGSAISTSAPRSASRASSSTPIPDAIDRVAAACARHGKALRPPRPGRATGIAYAARGLRIPVLVRRRMGAPGGGPSRHRRHARGDRGAPPPSSR